MGEPEPSIEIVPPSTEMFPPPRSVATPPEGGFGRVRGVGLLLGLGLCGGLGRGLGRGRGARLRGDRLSRYLGQQDCACDDRDADPLHELIRCGLSHGGSLLRGAPDARRLKEVCSLRYLYKRRVSALQRGCAMLEEA